MHTRRHAAMHVHTQIKSQASTRLCRKSYIKSCFQPYMISIYFSCKIQNSEMCPQTCSCVKASERKASRLKPSSLGGHTDGNISEAQAISINRTSAHQRSWCLGVGGAANTLPTLVPDTSSLVHRWKAHCDSFMSRAKGKVIVSTHQECGGSLLYFKQITFKSTSVERAPPSSRPTASGRLEGMAPGNQSTWRGSRLSVRVHILTSGKGTAIPVP